ncbi:glycosyltransferase family 2 protein [Actimicrobium antarcticum]
MKLSVKLSVIVITKNEARNIGACMDSVGFANQWIIVDSGSTDGTVAIARDFGADVLETSDWPGFGPQKNRALAAAEGEWVLSLDADERITPALRDEILRIINAPQHDAYALPRLSSFCGQFIRHSGWYPDHVVRLWRRGCATFSDNLVHERVLVERGTTGRLTNPIIHYSYRDDGDFLRKLEQYSELGARQAYAAGKRGSLRKAFAHSLSAFLRSFVFKRGFLDGRAGLIVALCAAETTYHKYFKLMLLTEAERGHDGDAQVFERNEHTARTERTERTKRTERRSPETE